MTDGIDRELRRARFHALLNTHDPVRRARIDDAYDATEVELLRERTAATRRERLPVVDFDGGRGVNANAPPRARHHWTDVLAAVLDER
ncbi:MAG: hypothetical protein ACRDLN_04465 [Solirubrobacteraceae bacterium]